MVYFSSVTQSGYYEDQCYAQHPNHGDSHSRALCPCRLWRGDVTVPPPPNAQPFESSGSPKVDQIIASWRSVAIEEMKKDAVKEETLVEEIFIIDNGSLADVQNHYMALTQNGWWHVRRMPGLQGDVLLDGYEHGTTALVIGAIDASKFNGKGIVVYTLRGTK
jgi:hypothetical protein